MRVLFFANKIGKTGKYHSVPREIIGNPPNGVKYIESKFKWNLFIRLKNKIESITKWNFLAPKVILELPEKSGLDLIHSDGFLIKNRTSWVESAESLHPTFFLYRKEMRKLYLSKYCKQVMPWSKASMMTFLRYIPELKNKIEVVYPTIKPVNIKKKKHKEINLLFVSGTHKEKFYLNKGGREVLHAFESLVKKFDVNLKFICNVPDVIKKRYENIVDFHLPNIPREKLLSEFYTTADIFVLPTYFDTFGMVFLEAMSAALPIVAIRVFATPEIVGDSKNGFLIDYKLKYPEENFLYKKNNYEVLNEYLNSNPQPEIVKQLIEKLSILIENTSLRKKMGKDGRKQIAKGKFSIKERNKKLKNIYKEAIR